MIIYRIINYLFITLLFFSKILIADELINRENQIKAVYLVHFAELTRWSEKFDRTTTFKICLYRSVALLPYLEELSQQAIGEKKLVVGLIETLNTLHQCQIIYFDTIDSQLSKLPIYPGILLIGNQRPFIDWGGSCSFTLVNNKIKLLINLRQIRQSGLDISSKLLRISEVIEQ